LYDLFGKRKKLMNRLKIVVVLIFGIFIALCFSDQFFDFRAKSQSGTPSAPTGIIASDGNYATKVSIMWNAIRGATSYRVFRNTINNSSTAVDIGTSVSSIFYDITAVQNQPYFYWVKAENSTSSSAFSSPDQGLRSNGQIGFGLFNPLEPPNIPAGNQMTATKIYLGKTLFWDEQMSATKTVSCGTCHIPASGGSDPRSLSNQTQSVNPGLDNLFGTNDDLIGSIGVPLNNANGTYSLSSIFGLKRQVTGRKANSFIDAAYSQSSFWDGRATSEFRDPITNAVILPNSAALESQAAGPPVSSVEMSHSGSNWTLVANRISNSKPLALSPNIPNGLYDWINGRTYSQLFLETYGSPAVTPAKIAMAIATYERSLFSDQTPIDKAMAQIEPLTAQEQAGQNLFVQLQCNACHNDSILSDSFFHNIGVRPLAEDMGRFAVTADIEDRGKFKTPSLRNVELRGPYMHNGKFNTLEEVVEFYNRGGDFDTPNIDRDLIRPLNLTPQQKADMVAFLKRPLTDPRVAAELPPFDRPALYADSNRVPQVSGAGVAGTGGQVPQPIAIEPPLVGNPSFAVAVTNAMGGANAVLVINSTDPGTSSIPSSGSFARQTLALQGTGSGNGYGSISLVIPNNNALIGQTFFGRWYVTDVGSASGFSVSRLFSFTIFGDATAVNRATPFDFDGDAKTDIGIFRPNVGQWWYLRSSDSSNRAFQFGSSTDKMVPADYTGDGKTDIAVFTPSNGFWNVLRSEDSTFYGYPFGTNGDIPIPADFDGDGKADSAIFRPTTATWYISKSSGGTTIQAFGANGDSPVPADYDGDGKADLAIFRTNGLNREWWLQKSSDNSSFATVFGTIGDRAVPGDYTGDGKTDIAIWRPSNGNWFILRSDDFSFYAFPFGANGDIPTAGDYDGDGKFDAAVFRPTAATWYLNRSTAGIQIIGFGANGDVPVPFSFVQ
jgi:cytochrome c peroxidase